MFCPKRFDLKCNIEISRWTESVSLSFVFPNVFVLHIFTYHCWWENEASWTSLPFLKPLSLNQQAPSTWVKKIQLVYEANMKPHFSITTYSIIPYQHKELSHFNQSTMVCLALKKVTILYINPEILANRCLNKSFNFLSLFLFFFPEEKQNQMVPQRSDNNLNYSIISTKCHTVLQFDLDLQA